MLIGAIGGLSKHAESDKQPPCNHDEVCSMCRIYMYIECSIRTYGGGMVAIMESITVIIILLITRSYSVYKCFTSCIAI